MSLTYEKIQCMNHCILSGWYNTKQNAVCKNDITNCYNTICLDVEKNDIPRWSYKNIGFSLVSNPSYIALNESPSDRQIYCSDENLFDGETDYGQLLNEIDNLDLTDIQDLFVLVNIDD
jgi:hypothetical protein